MSLIGSTSDKVLALSVRHGRTALNNSGKMRGWEDPPLNREGELDAEMAANLIRKYDPKFVYSSDLLRDIQTAQIICKALGNIPHEVDFRFRTANIGELSGANEEAAIPFMLRWYEDTWTDAPSGESYIDFCKRYDSVFFPKLELAKGVDAYRPSVFVAHGRNAARLHSYYTMTPAVDSLMPLPGGVAMISQGPAGLDQFEFLTPTERVVDDR